MKFAKSGSVTIKFVFCFYSFFGGVLQAQKNTVLFSGKERCLFGFICDIFRHAGDLRQWTGLVQWRARFDVACICQWYVALGLFCS